VNTEAALAYANRHELHALVIEQDAAMLGEWYASGYTAESPHLIYSGTKSFWGVAAAAAQDDGLLDLDELVSVTFPAWREDVNKSRVTLRMLLSLTSGFAFGGLGSSVPSFAAALAKEVRDPPGEVFTYGGIPLQVFGAVLARKLDAQPQSYLRERLLDPAGVTIASWRTLKDGSQPMPTGATLTARDWLAYGRFILNEAAVKKKALVSAAAFAECFRGSDANPKYGLGWWLDPLPAFEGIRYASGSGRQALYIIPSEKIVAVHFGKSGSWRHESFLKRLLGA
jgi:CubicO group peptidase (beta-lactamase class C family)